MKKIKKLEIQILILSILLWIVTAILFHSTKSDIFVYGIVLGITSLLSTIVYLRNILNYKKNKFKSTVRIIIGLFLSLFVGYLAIVILTYSSYSAKDLGSLLMISLLTAVILLYLTVYMNDIMILMISALIGIAAMVILFNNPNPSIEMGYILGFGISLALVSSFTVLFYSEPNRI